MKHRLDPLLRPRSVAIVGASSRADSMGDWVLRNLRAGGYPGRVFPVNPNYEALHGQQCFASLAALPERPELVVFAIGPARLETALDEAIAAGVPAAVIQAPLVLDDDEVPLLRDRVQKKIRDAGMLVCGANGMGYYNVRDRVWTCGFDSSDHEPPGNITLISHSGAGMSGIIDSDARLRINLAVSTGNEIGVSMDEYLDFALDLPETRVVGLFVETARNPRGFRAALSKAAQRRIPVVALKVGRTEKAAQLTVSHSGAMAGDDATYEALFDCYGVQRVKDQDEFATTLIMFAELHPVAAGGLVTLHDSGGERQLLVDLAHDADVPLTELAESTVEALKLELDAELPPVNPLDAWSRGGPQAGEAMTRCLSLMMQDEGAALGGVIHDRAPRGKIYSSYLSYMQRAHAESGKPLALVAARQGTGYDEAVVASTHAGFPVLDGVSVFLRGVRALFDYRDFLLQEAAEPDPPEPAIVRKWRDRLRRGDVLSESEALGMLADFDIEASTPVSASTEEEVLAAASHVGFPVVLKTAKEGLLHKSDLGGVIIGISDAEQLRNMYHILSNRLGAEALIAPMAPSGIEMFLGVRRDPQFGPIVLLGFGGVLAETINDVQFALPPFDAAQARRCVDRLQLRPLLDGVRGNPPVDVASFCEAASRFSVMAHALREVLSELDVNPVIVGESGAVAVDALAVGRDRRDGNRAGA